jgi:hypothetical protein
LIAQLGRLVICTAAGPCSLPTGVPRPDDPIIATSRWGRPAHRPPLCSPMGISWGSSPQGSPLTNHPSWRRRAQVPYGSYLGSGFVVRAILICRVIRCARLGFAPRFSGRSRGHRADAVHLSERTVSSGHVPRVSLPRPRGRPTPDPSG